MPVSSSVHRGENVDWWRITAPFGVGELRVTLDTNLQGGARPALFDIGGTEIPIRRATMAEAEARELPMPLYLAAVSENQPYNLRIEEPLRPIMIVWDTSGSTVPYKPAMDRALGDIALQADPDRDLIGFLPFGGSVLGDTLLGDPELLIRKLGNEAASGNSSNAEAALMQASTKLNDQDGVRGIILITDAATNRESALWQSLRDVRPRIGALALPSTGAFGPNPDRERDLMENWARANGGFYQYISTQSDFTEGFARAVDKMRGPKPYQMTISFGPFVPQPDGSLRVIETRNEGTSDQTITSSLLVLIDTSGSMLQRIDGKRRYQIAQDALAPLATQAAERGIAIGLRQFGIEPDACDTGLLAPIAPRSSREMTDILATILPKNNARTPIAAALMAAGEDLTHAQGVPRIVILTDGEETCDGDPEAVIKDLAAQGIAVRIDIVGFAIDDPALSASFADWARAGGGVYVNADDREALESALLDVSQTQFRALSDTGFEVAGIVGGDAIVLPAGRYTLILEGRDDPQEIEILSDTESVIYLNK
jgi:Mg-chelatase subunit ChlD